MVTIGGVEIGDISLRQLEHFLAVVEDGTIAAAATRLSYSASAVATSVTQLERAFGVQLCVRRRARGVTLTSTGTVVRDWARRTLIEAAELAQHVRGVGEELVGPLRIGCYDTLAPTVLPRLLDAYERRHPRVDVDFLLGSVEELAERLTTGELDVAVLYDLGGLDHLERHWISSARAYAYFGRAHPLAERETVHIEELAEQQLILFDRMPSSRYVAEMFAEHGLVPRIRHRTADFELARSIIARSATVYGLFLQRPATRTSYDGLPLVELEITPAPPACPAVLAWPREGQRSARARAFIDLVRGEDFTDLADSVLGAEDRSDPGDRSDARETFAALAGYEDGQR